MKGRGWVALTRGRIWVDEEVDEEKEKEDESENDSEEAEALKVGDMESSYEQRRSD
jgi:hypothetical protein